MTATKFGNPGKGQTCAGCGYFGEHRSNRVCHFTGEKVKDGDAPGRCSGFHAGSWRELWATEKKAV